VGAKILTSTHCAALQADGAADLITIANGLPCLLPVPLKIRDRDQAKRAGLRSEKFSEPESFGVWILPIRISPSATVGGAGGV